MNPRIMILISVIALLCMFFFGVNLFLQGKGIMFLLIRQFVKWIAVAFVIATPLTWLLLNRWLESFANRVSISPLYFLMGGGIVLAIT